MASPSACDAMIRRVLNVHGNVPGIALAIAESTEFQTAIARGLADRSAFDGSESTLEQRIRVELAGFFTAQSAAFEGL